MNTVDIDIPKSGSATILSISVPDNIIEVVIVDLSSKLILELVNPNSIIDIQFLPLGYYIVKVITKDKIYTAKLIKT